MERIHQVINQMIEVSGEDLEAFLARTFVKSYKRLELLSYPGTVPNEIFFLSKGLIRLYIIDNDGTEHTIHFAVENEFIADYSAFMKKQGSIYYLQALEETKTVIFPRSAVEWAYNNLKDGQKMGRLIAEYYFIYHDNRIRNMYLKTPDQRYDSITEVFPDIHNRVPQHMIASYLGITPVHLSRLKKTSKAFIR